MYAITTDLRINNASDETLIVLIGEVSIERGENIHYLGSIVSNQGGTDGDVKNKLQKATRTFTQLNLEILTTKLASKTETARNKCKIHSALQLQNLEIIQQE